MDTAQATEKRLAEIEVELSQLRERQSELKSRWQVEKDAIQAIQSLKAAIEHAKQQALEFERKGDLGKVAEIRYGKIIQFEQELSKAQEELSAAHKGGAMLKEEVDAEDIAEIVARWTGIPVQKMLEGERAKLLRMEERLHQRVIGQEEAVEAVSNAIRRSRAGLQDPNRPIGSFIFLGTTGVGKTELARALAEFLFDDEQAMVRIDMSEYMEKHAVSRLLGAPPGYVGYEEGGQLTEAVRRRPYSVVLLDEIEKAHPEVFNILLQLLDDGRLTDGQGRTVDFKNTIVIMTSNMGTEVIQQEMSRLNDDNRTFILRDLKEKVLLLLKERVRPEFLNRIDDIILFAPLSGGELRSIVSRQVSILEQKLQALGIALEISEAALDWAAETGYDINFGARPLKRLIQRSFADPLAMKILSGEITSGDKAYIDVSAGGEIFIRRLS